MGRLIVKNVGYIDIMDEISYEIAKEYLKLIAKKLGLELEERR